MTRALASAALALSVLSAGCARLRLDETRYRLMDGAGLHAEALARALEESPASPAPAERRILGSLRDSPGVVGAVLVGPNDDLRRVSASDPKGNLHDWLGMGRTAESLARWLMSRPQEPGGFGSRAAVTARAAAAAFEYRRPAVLCADDRACDLAYPILSGERFLGLLLVRVDPRTFDAAAFLAAQSALRRDLGEPL